MVISRKIRKASKNLTHSSRGLAIPVTFLILFASLITIISATYYFAVVRINSKSKSLNVAAAEQNMILLENKVSSVAWNEKSSVIYDFDDCGGTLKTKPSTVKLSINISGNSLKEKIYDCFIGKVVYELPSAETVDIGLYLKGDSRVIVNKSGSTMTKLFIINGAEKPEIILYYRPMVSIVEAGLQDGKPLNILRIYIINMNSSQSFQSQGEIPIKVSCIEIVSTLRSYNFSSQINSLTVNACLNGEEGHVSVPISSNENGAVVQVELVVCKIRIERGEL